MASRNLLPDLPTLEAALIYDEGTGRFTWRARQDVRPEWNTRYAGKLAGNTDSHGYHRIHVNGQKCWAHRVAWKMAFGDEPETIDHINGDPGDNRLSNLRAATNAENLCNRGVQKNNTSGFKGVYYHRAARKWAAQIKVARRWKYLGLFGTAEDAHTAYAKASESIHGEFGRAA